MAVKLGTIQTLTNALTWYAEEFYASLGIDVERWIALLNDVSLDELLPESKPEMESDESSTTEEEAEEVKNRVVEQEVLDLLDEPLSR